MAKPRKSHSERYDEYKELIESGKSISEIAKALDIKPQAVYFYLGSHEELPRPRGYVPQLERTINLDSNKKRELSRLVSQDYTRREIAGIMGMSYHGLGSYWDRKPRSPRSRIIFNPQKYRTIKRLLKKQAKQKWVIIFQPDRFRDSLHSPLFSRQENFTPLPASVQELFSDFLFAPSATAKAKDNEEKRQTPLWCPLRFSPRSSGRLTSSEVV